MFNHELINIIRFISYESVRLLNVTRKEWDHLFGCVHVSGKVGSVEAIPFAYDGDHDSWADNDARARLGMFIQTGLCQTCPNHCIIRLPFCAGFVVMLWTVEMFILVSLAENHTVFFSRGYRNVAWDVAWWIRIQCSCWLQQSYCHQLQTTLFSVMEAVTVLPKTTILSLFISIMGQKFSAGWSRQFSN